MSFRKIRSHQKDAFYKKFRNMEGEKKSSSNFKVLELIDDTKNELLLYREVYINKMIDNV